MTNGMKTLANIRQSFRNKRDKNEKIIAFLPKAAPAVLVVDLC